MLAFGLQFIIRGGDIMGWYVAGVIVAFLGGAVCYWYFIAKRKYVKIDTK
jgi:hypothetical protein